MVTICYNGKECSGQHRYQDEEQKRQHTVPDSTGTDGLFLDMIFAMVKAGDMWITDKN